MIRAAAKTCPLCRADGTRQIASCRPRAAIFRCAACGVRFAEHGEFDEAGAPAAEQDHFKGLDLDQYVRSVGATRLRSYGRLLERVERQLAAAAAGPRRWLDVGCSYGWLLKHLAEHGYDAQGIEPSAASAQVANDAGLNVRAGYFPQDVPGDERFDVISFMDVLEHFSEPRSVLAATRERLTADGLAVIQVPDQACLLYRLAEQMYRYSGGRLEFALRRLWLVDFDFPHQIYYTRATLHRLLEQAGYDVIDSYRSSIGSPLQAINRVGYARSANDSTLKTAAVGTAVGLINAVDTLSGYGGLLTVLARPSR